MMSQAGATYLLGEKAAHEVRKVGPKVPTKSGSDRRRNEDLKLRIGKSEQLLIR